MDFRCSDLSLILTLHSECMDGGQRFCVLSRAGVLHFTSKTIGIGNIPTKERIRHQW